MYYNYDISDKLVALAEKTEKKIQPIFENIDRICMLNSAKVLQAFQVPQAAFPCRQGEYF